MVPDNCTAVKRLVYERFIVRPSVKAHLRMHFFLDDLSEFNIYSTF